MSAPTSAGQISLERLNALPVELARRHLLACCPSARWAAEVDSGRPFASADEIIARSDAAVARLTRLSAPNKHHFLADLSPFGLDNPGEVFHAGDRPYGLIQCAVRRDDAEDPGPAWDSAAAFEG